METDWREPIVGTNVNNEDPPRNVSVHFPNWEKVEEQASTGVCTGTHIYFWELLLYGDQVSHRVVLPVHGCSTGMGMVS